MIKKGIVFLGLFIVACTPVPIDFLNRHYFDPAHKWKQIQTEHFQIYFYLGIGEAAQKAARIAEEVHTLLSPRIGWTPQERTHLVLTDHDDTANATTNLFPHNTMVIYLTSSASVLPREQFEDWMRRVITHEYVHILQLDMNRGLPGSFRTLFGRYPFTFGILNGPFPNTLQPYWLIEGLATDEETQKGGTNRAKSAYAEMLLRMAVLGNRFPTLDQAAGQLDTWPGPEVHYLFGARFLDYIRGQFGENALRALNENYSRASFPLMVDTNAKKTLGVSYLPLWDRWKEELTKQYTDQQAHLTTIGLTPTQPLTQHGDQNINPRIGPRGEIVYTRLDPRAYPALRIRTHSGEDVFLTRRNTEGSVSFSPDQSRLAFAQLEHHRNYSRYSDLYLLDLQSAKVKRLTQGARLRDPDFHPDGTRLVAIQGGRGKDRLVIYTLQTDQFEAIPGLPEDLLMHQPRWSLQGDKIVVSGWHQGYSDIYILNIASGQMEPIRRDKALDLTPTWSPDGRYIIFSSDRTGVYNLFAYQIETDQLFQITNLIGGAFMPDVGPDHPAGNQIVFSSYSAQGFDLHTLPWDPTSWKAWDETVMNETVSDASPILAKEQTEDRHETDLPGNTESPDNGSNGSPPLPEKPYSPWPTLRPRYWVPTHFIADPIARTTSFGFHTGGGDVLGKHRFTLDVSIGDQNTGYRFDYVNRAIFPAFYINVAQGYSTYTDVLKGGQDLEFGARFEHILFQRYASLSLGYRNGWSYGSSGWIADSGGLTVSGLWDSTQRYPFSISPEEGHQIGIRHWRYGYDDLKSDSWSLFINRYDTLFRPNHVLATELAAVIGDPSRSRWDIGGTDPFLLQGYPANVARGGKSAVGLLSYRFPLWNIERGIRTWPFFFSRLHGALFVNAGNAWDDKIILSDFKKGVGSELKMNMTFAYVIPIQWVLGTAKGIDEGGTTSTYFEVHAGF